jgi:hypothetical protein
MDWVWHAALIWVAVALPLALLTGHLLLRADRRDPPVVVSQSTDAHPAEEPQQFTPEPPAAPRRRTRSGPSDVFTRTLHPTGSGRTRPAGGTTPDRAAPQFPTAPQDADAADKGRARSSEGARRRAPMHRHL